MWVYTVWTHSSSMVCFWGTVTLMTLTWSSPFQAQLQIFYIPEDTSLGQDLVSFLENNTIWHCIQPWCNSGQSFLPCIALLIQPCRFLYLGAFRFSSLSTTDRTTQYSLTFYPIPGTRMQLNYLFSISSSSSTWHHCCIHLTSIMWRFGTRKICNKTLLCPGSQELLKKQKLASSLPYTFKHFPFVLFCCSTTFYLQNSLFHLTVFLDPYLFVLA